MEQMNVSPGMDVDMQPVLPKPTGVTNIRIVMEQAEGGAILAAMCEQTGEKFTAIVSGSSDSTAFKRKVQRTTVNWMKKFFAAPARAGSKESLAQEAADELASVPADETEASE